jgi:hypothetical protein
VLSSGRCCVHACAPRMTRAQLLTAASVGQMQCATHSSWKHLRHLQIRAAVVWPHLLLQREKSCVERPLAEAGLRVSAWAADPMQYLVPMLVSRRQGDHPCGDDCTVAATGYLAFRSGPRLF